MSSKYPNRVYPDDYGKKKKKIDYDNLKTFHELTNEEIDNLSEQEFEIANLATLKVNYIADMEEAIKSENHENQIEVYQRHQKLSSGIVGESFSKDVAKIYQNMEARKTHGTTE